MSDAPALEPSGEDIVVGVDGSPASVKAVRYAVEGVRRTHGVVHVVHVVPDYEAAIPFYPMPLGDLLAAGRDLLQDVLEQVGPVGPEVQVVPTLLRGSRVGALASSARGARALVVGSDRRPAVARLLTANTSTGVAASASVPVVAVPETWQPAAQEGGAVLVGVKDSGHATAVLGEAFAVAASRGSRLVVLHAWKVPAAYYDIVSERVAHGEWEARAREHLEPLLVEWRTSYPEVEVELRVVHDQAAHALVSASADVDEVVVVRRAHGIPAAVHLGSTARAVLREADCPVRVVPPGHVRALPGLVLEADGELLR